MPPKKRARSSLSEVTPAPAPQTARPPEAIVYKPGCDPESLVADRWTAEQETALLTGIIRLKPAGMHKHFRMLGISEYLQSQGYSPLVYPHTRIPNIWRKLRTLYNLDVLDEREDPLAFSGFEDDEEDYALYCPFELPEDEYGEMMFARRVASNPTSSPPLSLTAGSVRGSTRVGTDEPRSSPAPARGRSRGARGARQSTRSTRATRLQASEASRRRSQSHVKSSIKNAKGSDNETGISDNESSGSSASDGDEQSSAVASPPPAKRRGQTTRGRARKTRGATRRGRGRG